MAVSTIVNLSSTPKIPSLATSSRQSMRSNLKVLIAPSGFKECLGPEEVSNYIYEGLRRVLKDSNALLHKAPLHDGGEGFCKALVAVRGGEMRYLEVMGPDRAPINSFFGLIGQDRKTAVLEMAAAAGLRLVPKDCRNPTVTTTYGVGQLIEKALDLGCTHIIIGCGDSGTSDGGAGMLQALGARLLDNDGNELEPGGGGGALNSLGSMSLIDLHPRLRDGSVKIEAVCNIKNVLCGPDGVARVYGPQKGATPEQVESLASGLDRLAQVAKSLLNIDLANKPGSGASGGLGAGLMILGGELRPRSDAIDEYFQLKDLFKTKWDVVITAEGSLDYQSAKGKMTVEIARRARAQGAHVVALAGTIGQGAECLYDAGFNAFLSISEGPMSLEEAIKSCPMLLTNAAEKTIRMLCMGMSLQCAEPQTATRDKSQRNQVYNGGGHNASSWNTS
ncbi:hypothetical protein JX265_006910 [Neoarthrinium moseri]|uniref:Glycerate kinase n=1 Tax=Neoarthrinium moseri TaxID=1658444 RepID=A0A9P9WLI7_9PEZI|nr:hypothetical protein JX265_006910 [Neoarthrinium moseri]